VPQATAQHASAVGTIVEVPVTCPSGGSGCTVTVQLVVVEKVEKRKGAKTSHKTVVVGSSTITVSAGQQIKVHATLNAAGQRLLKQRHALPVTVKVSQGGKLLATGAVTVKAHAKRS
jgi:hypothetical protein